MSLPPSEGVQEVRRPLYRVSIKLLCLQERLHSQSSDLHLRPSAPLTFTLTFVSDLHLMLQQLLSSHLVSSCFSESRVSATRLGGVLLSGWGPPAAGRQAEPTGSDPHSEQDVPAGVTGSEGGPGGRGGDLQSDFQDV